MRQKACPTLAYLNVSSAQAGQQPLSVTGQLVSGNRKLPSNRHRPSVILPPKTTGCP